MNKRCSVCNHPSRAEIDRGLQCGNPRRALAARYGLSTAALSRHLRHLKQEIALQEHQAYQAAPKALLEQLKLLSLRLDRLYHHATDFRYRNQAPGCLRESSRLSVRKTLQERFRLFLRRTPPMPLFRNFPATLRNNLQNRRLIPQSALVHSGTVAAQCRFPHKMTPLPENIVPKIRGDCPGWRVRRGGEGRVKTRARHPPYGPLAPSLRKSDY